MVADEILKIVLELPLERQAAVMAFAQSIAEARREMWGNFPRDINPR
ncbi:MAG: hypothetical protein HUU16_16210 [Candidatus Omnitrophica bacterium]|nr:hypothetical protein [Candidatus Omnitrophota bacterium]